MADRTVTTLHGRQDCPDLKPLYIGFSEMPLVSIPPGGVPSGPMPANGSHPPRSPRLRLTFTHNEGTPFLSGTAPERNSGALRLGSANLLPMSLAGLRRYLWVFL